MKPLDRLAAGLTRKVLADPVRAAGWSMLPLIGRRVAEVVRDNGKRQDLLAMADARSARRSKSRLTLELYAKAAVLGGQTEFADTLYAAAADGRKLSEPAAFEHIRVLRSLNPGKALEVAAAAVRNYPSSGRLRLEHAICLWLSGNLPEASEHADAAAGMLGDCDEAQHIADYFAYQLGHIKDKPQGLARALAERLAVEPAASDVVVGILDYKSPDFSVTSSNLGDYIQSLAMLRHLARFAEPSWKLAHPDLLELVLELKRTWPEDSKPELRRTEVAVLQVDRDYADGEIARHADRTVWLPTFGWFMHPSFKSRMPFPYPDNVRPIILSLHLNKPDHLTPQVTDYLKRFEPIGCRDWSTCYWLLNAGVEAFFSGCVTLTLKLPGERASAQDLVVVDPPKRWIEANPGSHRSLTQVGGPVRTGRFSRLLQRSVDRLRQFESAGRIVTSRLHCYLPSLALGVPVEFWPNNPADRRFDGLQGLDPSAHAKISDGITEKLRIALDAILAGCAEVEVYARWKAACADDVAAAKAKLMAGKATDPIVPPAAVAAPMPVRSSHLDIALAFDNKIFRHVPTFMNSINKTTSRKIRFHILTRGIKDHQLSLLRQRFSNHEFNFIAMDGRFEGQKIHLVRHTTIATMDRLYLPDLLPDVDRLAYLDVDAVVLSNLEELLEYPTGDRGIAARNSVGASFRRQVNVIEHVARVQSPEKAGEIRRVGARDMNLMKPAFNAGVLVLSLQRLRDLGFTPRTIELVERFGMNDQFALNIFAGGEHAELPAAWNRFPYQENVDDAKLIHWAGGRKPWSSDGPARSQAQWNRYKLTLRAKSGAAESKSGVRRSAGSRSR
jgi:lipopolysaccharide biosynthesis glycosyltransferase